MACPGGSEAKGDAIVMSVDRFESMSDSELIMLFHNACKEKYEQLDQPIAALEKSLHARSQRKNLLLISKKLMKLEQGYEDVTRLDFFDSPYGVHVASRLHHLKQSLSRRTPPSKRGPPLHSRHIEIGDGSPGLARMSIVWPVRG